MYRHYNSGYPPNNFPYASYTRNYYQVPYYYHYPYPYFITRQYEPQYIPQPGYASPGSIFNIVNNCPSKWIYVWLNQVPQGQPKEFWIKVSQLDATSISGERIYTQGDQKKKDFASIDIANISQAICDPTTGGETEGTTPGGGTSQTTCAAGVKGEKIDSGRLNLEIVSINYEIHECEIRVVSRAAGLPARTDVFNRENNRISYEWGSIPTKQRITLEVRDKALYGSIEFLHYIPLVGWRLTRRVGPSKLGSWNKLKF